MPVPISQQAFQAVVMDYYHTHGRALPWRTPELTSQPDGSLDAYKIMVSELMLQQTQVNRVIPKYQAFLEVFPTVVSLAEAPLSAVLQLWNGLGYNRRAKYLHSAAQVVQQNYGGVFPRSTTELTALPGIGKNTAGAIMAYAFNEPVAFIETNIRTVYIHYFFHDQLSVADAEILALVEQTMDRDDPRTWYWALMDLGSTLKREVGNASRLSKGYTKQSRFEGSLRQLRGKILKQLLQGGVLEAELLSSLLDDRAAVALAALYQEGLVSIDKKGLVSLPL